MTPQFFEYEENRAAWYSCGSGKPLLILHGWGSSSELMLPLAEQLGEIRRCYLLDFPGFGHSPEPGRAWSVDNYAGLTGDFIRKVIDSEKVDLLVHSYGARVALKLLADPDTANRIGKVIFTGAAGLKPKRSFSFYLKKYTAKTLKLPFMILPGSLRDKALAWLRSTPLWKSLGSSDYQKLSGVMRETFVKSVTEYLDPLLPHIHHEVLLIWGKNDTATPIDQARRLEKGLHNSALVEVDHAGHYAFLDQPGTFSAIAKAYLEATDPSS
jgi:pimeloyl-ACP methyl ester carboxylesterase